MKRNPPNPFRYSRDPVFLGACALYLLNRFVLKPLVGGEFLAGHFNDCLLVPCALPLILRLHRLFRWRTHDRTPTWPETLSHLAVWSVLFEAAGPFIFNTATADPWDVAAYAAGAGIAMSCWHCLYR